MKNLVFVFLFICSLGASKAQLRNAIKVNAAAPLTQIWSVQHEFLVTDRLSFNQTLFYRNKSKIPFANALDKFAKNNGLGIGGIDFQYIFVDQAQLGALVYSPEVRFYLSPKRNSWFVGLFAQAEKFDMTVPAEFLVNYKGLIENVQFPVDFKISTMSGGILIGKQFSITDRLFVDFVLIGPHLGKAKKFDGAISQSLLGKLSDDEKTFLKEKVVERFKLREDYFAVAVENSGANITTRKTVPYFGLRGLGLNVGYRF